MKIEVAGAGAGKTSRMASRVLDIDIPDGKIVYCIAFTNAAAQNIRNKLIEQNGLLPNNIKVSTIHSFLYTEFIRPYYHLLYGSKYTKISTIKLPLQPAFRRKKINELDNIQVLHQTVIPERAKWVVYKKSNDNAQIKTMRAKIIAMFAAYCHKIIIDEAQDIDKNIRDILVELNRANIDIELYGDPKQDIKGYGCFRELINKYPDSVSYNNECHRSPQLHLQLSNRLAQKNEQQVADVNNSVGSMKVSFESDLDINTFVSDNAFGLVYISKKNNRYDTHAGMDKRKTIDTLRYELATAIQEKNGTTTKDLEIKRIAYYLAGQMIELTSNGSTINDTINTCIADGYYDYDKVTYAKIAEALKADCFSGSDSIVVKSIEAVKGLEHEKCLFILTTDLVPYLMGDKTDDNKTKNLLYVALTRSLDNLTILVTTEVENRYTRKQILDAFEIELL